MTGNFLEQFFKRPGEGVVESLPGDFDHEPFVVVVAKSSAQLLVGHQRSVFVLTPEARHLVRVEDSELPLAPRPGNYVALLSIQ